MIHSCYQRQCVRLNLDPHTRGCYEAGALLLGWLHECGVSHLELVRARSFNMPLSSLVTLTTMNYVSAVLGGLACICVGWCFCDGTLHANF